jgi:hypothetical protein
MDIANFKRFHFAEYFFKMKNFKIDLCVSICKEERKEIRKIVLRFLHKKLNKIMST